LRIISRFHVYHLELNLPPIVSEMNLFEFGNSLDLIKKIIKKVLRNLQDLNFIGCSDAVLFIYFSRSIRKTVHIEIFLLLKINSII